MKLDRILPFARKLLKQAITEGDTVVDATIGNGHDTLYLAKLVGERGHIYGFDIQEEAVKNTTTRLIEHHLQNRATIVKKSHDTLQAEIPISHQNKITAAIFNLGYLPGGSKEVVTRPNTTIAAIEQLLQMMAPEGVIVLVIYHGHEEGAVERDALLNYVTKLDQQKAHVLSYRFVNQANNPPFIIAIEKR